MMEWKLQLEQHRKFSAVFSFVLERNRHAILKIWKGDVRNMRKKRRWGDRYDGRRVRSNDPFFYVIPHVMNQRTGSMVFFDEIIDISSVDGYIHKMRAESMPDLRFLHVLIAAMVRVISQKPKVNRFVSGRKIYARNYIRIPITIKRSLSEASSEEVIQPEFEPTDTLADVVEKVNHEVTNVVAGNNNSTGSAASILRFCPGFLLAFIVWLVRRLDGWGWMPKFLNRASPFHGTVFITDLGSLGVKPVYHHLYDFGTCSVFVAFGKKERIPYLVNNETISEKKVIGMRVVVDERICDGFYFASALKLLKRILKNPALLEQPPEQVSEDNEV